MNELATPLRQPYFTSDSFDRAAALRSDQDRIEALLDDSTTRFLPFWRRQHLLSETQPSGGLKLARLRLAELALTRVALRDCYTVFLGFDGVQVLFGIDLSPIDDIPAVVSSDGRSFAELRPYEFRLNAQDSALIAQFRAMANWRTGSRFCGQCAAPTRVDQAGYRSVCTNGHEQFPRTDPVVVILVCHQERVLLAHGTRFPNKRLFSALSGFIEPGETAEQAALREAFEEVGVQARSIRYHSSQPWPFPGLIMMGFLIEAMDTALTLDSEEIAEARWFTREEIAGHDALGFDPPSPNMLAGQLLKVWIEQ
ncbi:MAG TPA: NAD(+) diphosphatase [Xanthobacteraceae bacterium]|nr:NAD(+) diphosphatase [Xanthobacteraceae bacterium]